MSKEIGYFAVEIGFASGSPRGVVRVGRGKRHSIYYRISAASVRRALRMQQKLLGGE